MIKIECDIFHLCTEDHVIILGAEDGLVFDSGTHKSHFITELIRYRNNRKIVSNCVLIIEDTVDNLIGFEFTEKHCIVIDEANFAPHDLEDLFERIRAANAYLMIVGRICIKQLECSVDAIYLLKYHGGNFYTRRLFSNVSQIDRTPDQIACEDNVAIANVYAEALEVDNVVPVCGRGNFYKYIRKYANPMIIADKPKFGQNLLTLLYMLKINHTDTRNLILFLPDCFEEIICELAADNIEAKLCSSDNVFDKELFYEMLAKQVTCWDKHHVTRSMKELRKCLDFSDSEILKDLCNLYYCRTVTNASRCYLIELDNVKI